MKKVILILCVISLFSCKKEPGTISGVVTYFFNEYQGDKPDIGAKVYIINNNRDDLKKSIEYIKSNDLSKEPVFKKTNVESNLYYKAYLDSCTIKKTVDGGGNYSIQVQPGDYTVIIESNGRLLMKKVLTTRVKSKEISNVDCRFDLN